MATWIAHLRVAENVLNEMNLDRGLFLIGNLAPDCNKPNEDWSSFTPDGNITHFRRNGSDSEPEIFLDEHYEMDDKLSRRSFILGYYAHLVTDNLWGEMIDRWKDDNPDIKDKLDQDKSYIWTIKKDWYGQDFKYLRENERNIFADEFLSLGSVDDYLDFFPSEIMNDKLDYIKAFYTDKEKEIILDQYKYLSNEQMDMFVLKCGDVLIDKLTQLIM